MFADRVRNPEHALAYLVDCTLATVADLASKKSSSKYELRRQTEIAQKGIEWLRNFKIDYSSTRAHDIVEQYEGSVAQWAEQYRPRQEK